ncbi:LysR family transcriptional regulator [Caballeronia terrestris]|uniref:LysR family transcriptional regulator n=1 Tax=Caballeronia terrestris TaxID=1226301 RepID=A0A158KYQ9_9BURK|nr:LysR family transcriptional regulator [Caballeronia terrestris]SAL85853.1 LysR family transcriptional regulator [Caballeronia terrestris]
MSKDRPATYLNDRLDWNLLRTFLAIAREKSVSRAATRLHLTQPAVSQALKRLEDQLGMRLVDRHGPRIEVTQAGIEVQQIAEDVYGTISRLSLAKVDRDHDISGMVRLSTVSGIDFPAYDAFLAGFHRSYPRIELESQEMRSADVVASLQQKSATLGLTPRRALPKKIESRLFLRQRYALFCGRHHPLFGRTDLKTADLVSEKFVSFTGDKVGDHMSPLTFFRDEMGFTERVVGSSSSMSEVKRFIFAGFGIGCLPEHVVRDDVANGRFQRLPPDEGVADLDIYLLWSGDRKYSAAESAFLDALHAFIDAQDADAS